MDAFLDARLETVDRQVLTPIVRRALQQDSLEVVDWSCKPLHGGAGFSARLYRLAGTGLTGGRSLPWSLVLKLIARHHEAADPHATERWDREPLAYMSGLLAGLPGGLRAPRLLGVEERPQECWLWLEEVWDSFGPRWPLERYGLAARHLAELNAAYLGAQPLPDWPWFSRKWLRAWLEGLEDFPQVVALGLADPLVHQDIAPDILEGMLRVWDERERWLDTLEAMPQTICHLDAFRRNLFARRGADGRDETVAIDWAYCGLAAPGEELAPLVTATVAFFEEDVEQFQALEQISFDGYLQGLHDAGWRGDPGEVRFAYAASSVLRYGSIITRALVHNVYKPEGREGIKQMLGRSYEELLPPIGRLMRVLLGLADECRSLLRAGS